LVPQDAAAEEAVAAAARGAAEAPQQAAVARAGVAERQQAAVAARDAAAGVLRRAAAVPGAQGALQRAALPSAPLSASAFRRDQALPWPGPQPAARFARAMQRLRIAWP
jgi:hypothetical protein